MKEVRRRQRRNKKIKSALNVVKKFFSGGH